MTQKSDDGPNPGLRYVQHRNPHTICRPVVVPQDFEVLGENIITWAREDEFHCGHELVARLPDGEIKSAMTLIQRGDLGAARASSYRTLGVVV